MVTLTDPSESSGQPGATGSARARTGRAFGFVPLALALVITLVLGGASVARSFTSPPLDAHTDLEFSLDGTTWSDAPEAVLGKWGCDLAGGPGVPNLDGAIGGAVGVDPCAMSPGEYIDRTYYVRNSTNTGRTGLYEVGIGEFELSELAEFNVESVITVITGVTGDGEGDYTLYGPGTAQADQTPHPETRLAALMLAPGASATVVDTVSIPGSPENYEQDQSVSPRIWVSFSDIGVVDSDGDGLPNNVEGEIGTDPDDPYNPLSDGTVGHRYGPQNFLPTTPEGASVVVDMFTLPPGITLENGVLGGRPTEAGSYGIEFTITMPGGAEYTSIRRVVVHPGGGGGSSDLPDVFWPVVVGGIIGVIVGITVPGSASTSTSTAGSNGSSGPAGSRPGTGVGAGEEGNAADSTTGPATNGSGPGVDSAVDDTTGQIRVESVTPREGSPSDEWARANSEVRSSLPTTGVGAVDLLLWALTAAAAGVALILFARRRRSRDVEE